jgi:signal transduction histidine kinase
MKTRTQMALWYFSILLAAFLLVGGWAYYEMVVEHPGVKRSLAQEGYTVWDEFGEVMLYGGLPAVVLALVGGWFLMQRAFSPIATLTRAVEQVHADNLGQKLPSLGKGDELDRLHDVFNSMMTRLNDSFSHVRDFTLHASHELKTPLTILRGEIETRMRDPALSAADREFFVRQLDEIARLAKTVDALTLLTRADAGQLVIANDSVQLDELVRDSFADAQLLAQSAGLEVELPVCDRATVRGDRHRLRQVLVNLTDNAIKYNHNGGRVTMNLERRNGRAELTVANTGPGIPPEKLPRVFERFYRGDTAHSDAVEGCGLGLSIVDSIVKAHGGKIRLESDPARLTIVKVTLPAVA